jgi:hypothetical protein
MLHQQPEVINCRVRYSKMVMNDESEETWKEVVVDCFKESYRYLPGIMDKYTEKQNDNLLQARSGSWVFWILMRRVTTSISNTLKISFRCQNVLSNKIGITIENNCNYSCKKRNRLCGLVVRVSGYRFTGSGFDSRRFQIFWEAMSLERGPLSLVRTTEELLGRNSSGSGQGNRD